MFAKQPQVHTTTSFTFSWWCIQSVSLFYHFGERARDEESRRRQEIIIIIIIIVTIMPATKDTEKENDDHDDDNEEEEEEVVVAAADSENNNQKKRKRKRKRKTKSKDDDGDNQDSTDNKEKIEQNEATMTTPEDESKAKELDRTIFVEGIPFTCTVDQVRQFFTQQLLQGKKDDDNDDDNMIVDLRLPVWHDSGRLRGYGHVVFRTREQYEKALTLSGKYLHNRYLTIQPAQAPKSGSAAASNQHQSATMDHSNPSVTVALHNLSYEATEDDVQKVMERFGTIAPGGVRIVRHSHTGRSKGFGYVQYTDTSASQKAVRQACKTPIVIAGRACRTDYDHGRVRGSFRTADRKLWHKEFKRPRNNNSKSNDGDDENDYDAD